jgi:hypothetical protein
MKRISMVHVGAALAVLFTLCTSIPQAAAQQVGWITVRDNREQAFSIDVPRGWKVFGGMFRFSLIDARPFVDMTSPDGKINLRIGDASIPPYSAPKSGFAQVRAMQLRQSPYVTGDQFAVKYGQARFRPMCDGLRLTRSQAKQPKFNAPGQGAMRVTAGEAVFSCTVNGQPTTGYVYAETFVVGYGGPIGNWSVLSLGSVFAPTDQAMAAAQLLAHVAQSQVMNPQWAQMQHGFENLVARSNMAQALATIRRTAQMNADQQRVIQNMGHEQDNFNDIVNGVSFKRDPATGQEYETPLGTGGPQWIDPQEMPSCSPPSRPAPASINSKPSAARHGICNFLKNSEAGAKVSGNDFTDCGKIPSAGARSVSAPLQPCRKRRKINVGFSPCGNGIRKGLSVSIPSLEDLNPVAR